MKLKKTILLMSALAAAVLITSCDKDENEVKVNDGSVRFTATIANQAVATPSGTDGARTPVTRVSGTQWNPKDGIGIYMTAHGTTTIAEGAENRPYYTPDGTGNFSPWTPDNAIYYPLDNSAVDFIAYYPCYEVMEWDKHIFSFHETFDPGETPYDLLWAKSDNSGAGYSKKNGGTVALEFRHCFAKLTMNVQSHPSVGTIDPATMTVTIKGTPKQGTFYPQTGIVEPGMEVVDRHPFQQDAPSSAKYFATYTVTTPPAAYTTDGQIQVDFQVGSETFTWNVEAVEFEPGKDYVYDVTITRTGVKATGTIIDWVTVNKGEVTAQ